MGKLTLYHCQKKIRTKEDNSSDVIDLITLSNIDDTARDTGTADRITKDDTCSDTCMLAAYTVATWFVFVYISFYYFSSEHTVLRMLADKSY